LNTVLKGTQMTQAGQLISSQLELARQLALSRNHSVEVRLYQYGDPGMPGEQASSPGTGNYRAVQTFDIQDSGSAVALGNAKVLPSSIIIDSGTTLSSMIGGATSTTMPQFATGASLNVPVSSIGTQYNCVFFRFLPDGSTNIPTSQVFLTLHNINDGKALTNPPPNFITIQIDSINGHLKTFRP